MAVRVFPKSANQPNEIALSICNSISRNCFQLRRDWKVKSSANGKEISAVPFRTENKKRSTSEGTPQFPNGISLKITLPFDYKPKFPDFLAKW